MKNVVAVRAAVAAAAWSTATSVALASGEATGTEAVGEMQVSGGQFAMILGAVVVLGLVVWVVAKKLG